MISPKLLALTGIVVISVLACIVLISNSCSSNQTPSDNSAKQSPKSSTELKAEFFSEAPQAWLQMRKELFDQRTWKSVASVRNRADNDTEWSEYSQDTLTVAQAPLFYQEQKTDYKGTTTTEIIAGNSKYAFELKREGDSEYELVATDLLTNSIPGFESGDLGKHRRRNSSPQELIRVAFSSAAFLNLSGQPIERFFEDKKNFIVSFSESQDEFLGRLVIVHLGIENDTNVAWRERDGTWSTLISGSITLLPERNWTVCRSRLKHDYFGENGDLISDSSNDLDIRYNIKDANSFLPLSLDLSTRTSKGAETFTSMTFNALTNEEIDATQTKCYLSGFNLLEPDE